MEKHLIVNSIQKVCDSLGRIPTCPEYDKLGSVSRATIRKEFGSWSNAITTIFNQNPYRIPRPHHSCYNCGKETKNPKYCSRTCSVSSSNISNPKRKLKNTCKNCSNKIRSNRTYCVYCLGNLQMSSFSLLPLNEVQGRAKYQISAEIRNHARRVYKKSDLPKQCIICNYSLHYEVCHKKPINQFAMTSIVSEINSINNLVALCRNHHWEFDNGFLSL